ncbi:hypothetical protein LINGRAHAP2_LOCUS15452 [Linum grandiflorum]
MASELCSEKSDSLLVRFNGKNYSLWEFQFRYFVAGKGLISYLDGRATEPIAPSASSSTSKEDAAARAAAEKKLVAELMTYAKELEKWNLNNAKVFSCIINSVELRIALTLRMFTSATAIWSHLEKTVMLSDILLLTADKETFATIANNLDTLSLIVQP